MTYNTRSPAVKRLMKEAQELSEPTELFYAKPLEDNLFEWHFTIRGPIDTDYDGGIYHGRILLPAEYPMKPPNILLMTPSGRFEINRKICLSISGYHPETWRPSWSIRTALLAIIGFMPTHGVGAIGSLDYPPEERRKLAKISVDYVCPQCGGVKSVLKSLTEASVADVNEAKNLASQISFTGDKTVDKSALPNEAPREPLVEIEKPKPEIASTSTPTFVEDNPMIFMPNMPMQPLSFEEWFNQMKSVKKIELKGDECTSNLSSVLSDVIEEAVSLNIPQNTQGIDTVNGADEPRVSSIISSNGLSESNNSIIIQPDINPEAVRLRNLSPQNDALPYSGDSNSANTTANTTTTTNTANIDLASLRQRQSVLLKCIIFVAGVLGFILAARLNNLHGEVNN